MIADEIELRFVIPAAPRAAMETWRTSPPAPVQESGLALVDRTVETLMYEKRYQDGLMKLSNMLRFGSLVKLPKEEAIWRMSVRFDAAGTGTQVSVVGRLEAKVREALGAWAAQNGRIVFAAGAGAGVGSVVA